MKRKKFKYELGQKIFFKGGHREGVIFERGFMETIENPSVEKYHVCGDGFSNVVHVELLESREERMKDCHN